MYQFGHLRTLPVFYNQQPNILRCDLNGPKTGKLVSWNTSSSEIVDINLANCEYYTEEPGSVTVNVNTTELGIATEILFFSV